MRRCRWWTVLVFALTLAPGIAAAAEDPLPAPATSELPLLPEPRVRAWQTGLLRPDRVQHASLSLTLGLSFGLVTREPAAAVAGSLSLGVLKELWDMRRSRFDVVDLCADALGTAVAAAAVTLLEK